MHFNVKYIVAFLVVILLVHQESTAQLFGRRNYKARQESLDRTVAVKMIRGNYLASEEHVRRFQTEAKAAAQMSHPNIVPIHDLDVHKGQPFFTMDYIDGPSLEGLCAEGRITLRQAAEVIEKGAGAISPRGEQYTANNIRHIFFFLTSLKFQDSWITT